MFCPRRMFTGFDFSGCIDVEVMHRKLAGGICYYRRILGSGTRQTIGKQCITVIRKGVFIMEGKKLMLSRTNRQFMGVCGGIAEYLGVDPTVVRVLWVVGTFVTAFVPATILYFVLGFIIPQD